MISLILAAAIATSSPVPVAAQDQWVACARSVAEAKLAEQGIPAAWPKVDSLPSGETPVSVDLGSSPDEPAYDPVHRVLYGYSSTNAIYIESFGGIGDLHTIYGPISLQGRCTGSPPHAP
jgi:hypothetical protein